MLMRIKQMLLVIILQGSGVYTHEPDGEFNALISRRPTNPRENATFSEEVILDKLNNLKVNK